MIYENGKFILDPELTSVINSLESTSDRSTLNMDDILKVISRVFCEDEAMDDFDRAMEMWKLFSKDDYKLIPIFIDHYCIKRKGSYNSYYYNWIIRVIRHMNPELDLTKQHINDFINKNKKYKMRAKTLFLKLSFSKFLAHIFRVVFHVYGS
jgi:hypothetical protein